MFLDTITWNKLGSQVSFVGESGQTSRERVPKGQCHLEKLRNELCWSRQFGLPTT